MLKIRYIIIISELLIWKSVLRKEVLTKSISKKLFLQDTNVFSETYGNLNNNYYLILKIHVLTGANGFKKCFIAFK